MHRDLQAAAYVSQVAGLCGDAGSEPLQQLLGHVGDLYRVLSPDRLSAEISVAIRLDDECGEYGTGVSESATSIEALTVLLGTDEAIAIEMNPRGGLRYWVGPATTNGDGRLIYVYRGAGDEAFVVAGAEVRVPPLDGHLSRFAVPYFTSLASALENYRERCARFSQCPTLARAWRDKSRLIFAPAPEHHMRDSLVFWLRNTLRGTSGFEVMPEQNVNATRPVDVKVKWNMGRQMAMIEIKWLGKSAAEGAKSWGSQHGERRGPEGLQQLATYLDLYRVESPDMDARGYLVVFDGRRDSLKISGNPISLEAGYFYKDSAIAYQADLLARRDMAAPVRFFLEPDPSGLVA